MTQPKFTQVHLKRGRNIKWRNYFGHFWDNMHQI